MAENPVQIPQDCLLCDKPIPAEADVRVIKDDYLEKIIKASKSRGDKRHTAIMKHKSITVHLNCAKNYARQSRIEAHKRRINKEKIKAEPSLTTRSSGPILFKFADLCFICGEDASDTFLEKQKKLAHKRRQTVHKVIADHLRQSIINKCGFLKSKFTIEILSRIEGVSDLVSVGARYHGNCLKNFHKLTNNLSSVEETNTSKAAQFIASYIIENKEECQFSITSILEKFEGDENVEINYLKELLYQLLGNEIIIHPSKDGHIITFIDAGKEILTDSWYKKQQTLSSEKERANICKAAGKILFEDIRKKIYDTDSYPAPENIVDEVNDAIPESLKLILDEIILKNKRNERVLKPLILILAHTIISATRPRSFLSPILIGLGAMLDKLDGSKELVQTLNAAGLCASYDEIRLFEDSLLSHFGNEEKIKLYKNAYLKMVFDNADHDVRTIDDENTFHIEGGNGILTSGNEDSAAGRVPRLNKIPKSCSLGKLNDNGNEEDGDVDDNSDENDCDDNDDDDDDDDDDVEKTRENESDSDNGLSKPKQAKLCE